MTSFFGDRFHEDREGPPAPGPDQVRMAALDARVTAIEESIVQLCFLLRQHLDRIDQNTQAMDRNMRRLAAMTLRPPRDLLGGTGGEPN